MVSTLAKATGHQIKGWRALTETLETPHRLKELGLTYILIGAQMIRLSR